MPLAIPLTGGNRNDSRQRPVCVLGERGYGDDGAADIHAALLSL